jgi:hypothetical protein
MKTYLNAILLLLTFSTWIHAQQWLREDTVVTVKLGPFVDSTDGATAKTGLTIQKADVRLSKNGGDMAAASADQGSGDAGAPHECNQRMHARFANFFAPGNKVMELAANGKEASSLFQNLPAWLLDTATYK